MFDPSTPCGRSRTEAGRQSLFDVGELRVVIEIQQRTDCEASLSVVSWARRVGLAAAWRSLTRTNHSLENPVRFSKLYTLGITGVVTSFDARTGARIWQTQPPAEAPFYSAASSPAADKRLVFSHPGNYGPLTAFDADTGTTRWTSSGDGLYASPIVVTIGGVRQVVSVLQESVIGASPDDGRLLWRYPWKALGGSTTPLVHGDTIILSGLDMGMTAIKPVIRNGAWFADVVWTTNAVSAFLSNPVIVDGAIYGLSHRASGQYFAVDAATGQVLWLGPPRQAANTAVVKAGQLLFLLNDDAELIVARASRSAFEPIKRYVVADSEIWAQPAISGNRIFVKDVSALTLWTVAGADRAR